MGTILNRRIGMMREPHQGESVALALAVAAGDVGSHIETVLGDHGLTSRQYAILRMLRGALPRGLRHGDIQERLLMGRPDVTRLTRRMERNGWIARERDGEDRRVVHHRVTARGRAKLDEVEEPLRLVYDHIIETLGAGVAGDVVAACEAAIVAAARMGEPEATEA